MYKIIPASFICIILASCGQDKKENTVLNESLESVTGTSNAFSDSINSNSGNNVSRE